jgi:hypothetical protein
MATYATKENFEDETGGEVSDPEQFERILLRAERQVDDLLTGWGPSDQNGLRIAPALDLEPYQRDCLMRATVAQVEYRLEHGEEFFRTNEPRNVSGPDFGSQGRRGKYADATFAELRRGGILKMTASL